MSADVLALVLRLRDILALRDRLDNVTRTYDEAGLIPQEVSKA